MEINNNNVQNTAIGKKKMEDGWSLTLKVKTNFPKYDCNSKNVCISTFWRFQCQRLVNDVSRDHFDAIEWIIYQDDRVVSYLVCLIYTFKWFHVAYNCNVRSWRFQCTCSKRFRIQDDLGAKSTKRRFCSYLLFEAVCQTISRLQGMPLITGMDISTQPVLHQMQAR